jgi:hypothetical protein
LEKIFGCKHHPAFRKRVTARSEGFKTLSGGMAAAGFSIVNPKATSDADRIFHRVRVGY